jgi:hypothetical protein
VDSNNDLIREYVKPRKPEERWVIGECAYPAKQVCDDDTPYANQIHMREVI